MDSILQLANGQAQFKSWISIPCFQTVLQEGRAAHWLRFRKPFVKDRDAVVTIGCDCLRKGEYENLGQARKQIPLLRFIYDKRFEKLCPEPVEEEPEMELKKRYRGVKGLDGEM